AFGQQIQPQEMTIEDSCPHVDDKFLYRSQRYTGKGIIHHLHVCIMYVDNAFSRKAGLKVVGNRGLECVVTSSIQCTNCS
ncbi:hypothetical protein NPIL_436611, partial [Nephila pilipes]